ncbi:MAG: choice-of-anchor X domain-containing protein [Candidatus Nanopelagicales bacterium]
MKAKIWFATATATSLVLASAGTAWAAADTTAPVVNSVDLPTGQVGPQFVARANVTDDQSGVGKVYLYIDDSNGRHVSGIQLWDDATHSDSMAFDNTYSAAITLGLNAGTYRVSILTLDSKYNELKKPVASVVVTGQSYTWSPVTATPPPHQPSADANADATPMPSQPSSDTAPPTVTDVSLPASTTATSTASAVVRDPGSGVNKVYLYVDRADGTNAAGIRLWDDGTNSDPIAADSRYTGTSTLNLPNGTYNVSILTYDAKYNETKPRVGSLVVAGTTYTWRSVGFNPNTGPHANTGSHTNTDSESDSDLPATWNQPPR